MTSNSKVLLELDRDAAEFLDRTGEEAQKLLIGLVGMGGDRKHMEKVVNYIENWNKVRAAVKAAGVERNDG